MQNVLSKEDTVWLEASYEKLKAKMTVQCERIGGGLPFVVREGRYAEIQIPDKESFWTNGFWPGMLWQMYNATGDEAYKRTAESVEEHLEKALRDFEGLHHDVGFMYLLSSVANYRITGNKDSYRRGVHAATLLAGRYNPNGEFIRAWNDSTRPGGEDNRGWMIIDSLMNIPILYWVSAQTNDPRFAQIADRHAATAQKYIVRPDGSCNHIVNFDPDTGEYVSAPDGQGYDGASSWSRGQSWAVYGFTAAYRHSGNIAFLDTAKRCAHYCIANLAITDWLPLVDFRAPAKPVKYDSGAGVIIACGLLELAGHVPDFEKRLYIDAAVKMLRACDASFSNWNADEDAIMCGGSLQYHNDHFPNTAAIYNDYFFVEAILRLLEKDIFLW